MSAVVALETSEQYIVLAGSEQREDVPRLVEKLTLPGHVAISFRHVGAMNEGFLGALVEGLAAAGAQSVRAIEPTPYEAKFLRLVASVVNLPFAA